jgi:hypothetical protein
MIGLLITTAIVTTPVVGLLWLAFVLWEALDN